MINVTSDSAIHSGVSDVSDVLTIWFKCEHRSEILSISEISYRSGRLKKAFILDIELVVKKNLV